MREFRSSISSADVSGQAMLSLVSGAGELSPDSLEGLNRQSVESAASGVRYAPPAWRNAFQEISEDLGPSTVFQIGVKIGRFGFIELGRSRAKLVCANASPCESDQRLITDMAQRSASPARAATVVHDPSQPCRQKGGASCTYLVSW